MKVKRGSFDLILQLQGSGDFEDDSFIMATLQDRVREIVSRSVASACASIARDLPARILADPDGSDCGAVSMDDSFRSSDLSERVGAAELASTVKERGSCRTAVGTDANELHGIAETLVSIRNIEQRTTNESNDSDTAPARTGPAASVSQRSLWTREEPTETTSSAHCKRTANESTESDAAPAKAVPATSRHAVSQRSLWIRQESMKPVSSADRRLPQVPAVCVPERIRPAAATVEKRDEKKTTVRNVVKRKARGCGRCDGCTREDCGKCAACLDKTKFGGANLKKKRCVRRVCDNPYDSGPAEKKKSRSTGRDNAVSDSEEKVCRPWTEEVIEEFIRLRREKFRNSNSWTEIAALISKPGGFKWQATHLANLVGTASLPRPDLVIVSLLTTSFSLHSTRYFRSGTWAIAPWRDLPAKEG